MIPAVNTEPWQRLAQLLIARRVELGYHQRADWVRHLGVKQPRTIEDFEKARRTNYRPSTIALMERYYAWESGSIDAVLAGGEPTPTPELSDDALGWYRHVQDPDFAHGVEVGLDVVAGSVIGWPENLDENNVAAMRGAAHAIAAEYGRRARHAKELRQRLNAVLTELERAHFRRGVVARQLDTIWSRAKAVGNQPTDLTSDEYAAVRELATLYGRSPEE